MGFEPREAICSPYIGPGGLDERGEPHRGTWNGPLLHGVEFEFADLTFTLNTIAIALRDTGCSALSPC